MAIRAAVFDRDGVLAYFDFRAVTELFRELGLPLDRARSLWEAHCSNSAAPASEGEEQAFLATFWGDLADDCGVSQGARARLHAFDYTDVLKPYADARATLEAVRRRGLSVGVLSNFPMASLGASLDKLGLRHLVDVAGAAPIIGAAKPDARAYRFITDALGTAPEECVFVDDEPACVAGARAVGMQAFLLDRSGAGPGDGSTLRDLGTFLERVDALLTAIDEPSLHT